MTTLTKIKTNVTPMTKTINDDYDNFLNDKKANSFNTYKSYKGDLEKFFGVIFDIEPKHVTIEQIESLTGSDIIKYRNMLREDCASSTVNRKMNSVRAFFKFLEVDNPSVRSAIFNNAKKIKQNDSNGWGILTYEEVMQMINLSKGMKNGEEVSLFIELGFKTSIRLNGLLEMTWNDIYLRHQHGKDIRVIEIIEKGSKHTKAISDEVYSRLEKLKCDDNNSRVFRNLHAHKVGKIIKELSEQMGIDPRRNIRFHSLKKAGVNYVYDVTGDIMLAKKQGNHKSASTTIDSYMKYKEDLTSMPSYTMGEDIDLSPLKELSKEELLAVIESCSASAKFEILRNKG